MPEFTHLHLHTQYSVLDGATNINALMQAAAATGMKAVAITDHGNMFGVMDFFQSAQQWGIKPIIGCEVYVARNGMQAKSAKSDRSGHHLILLAKNKIGYQNLIKMVSISNTVGFYYTPRIDKELLEKHHEGLIACSACLGGEIPSLIMNGNINGAAKVLEDYLLLFRDDFYLEMMRHGLPEQDIVNKELLQLAKQYKVKIVATNDVHFLRKDDFEAHRVLISINTGRELDGDEGLHYSGNEYFRSPDEMAELFYDLPEAIINTMEIADKVEEYQIKRDALLPEFELPQDFVVDQTLLNARLEKWKTRRTESYHKEPDQALENIYLKRIGPEFMYLEKITWEGALKRYSALDESTKERIEFELGVIELMGFPGYFLIVQDFIAAARKMGVIVGPGRGSAAGSAVAYCIGITNIDPIHYNLLFERFLNPERISLPDIDVDFDDDGRDKVIRYVQDKYGRDRVAQIITFGTLAAKSAIRDVARVLKVSLDDAGRLAKLVPDTPGTKLQDAVNKVPELLEEFKNGHDYIQRTLRLALSLEGSIRNTGTHACGVIIGPEDLTNHVPLAIAKDSELPVVQYEGSFVEAAGMLKMDFLGLKTLSIIKEAIESVRKSKDILVNIDEIPLDDKKTFELYQNGDTFGTFQFESDGMREYLRQLKPTSMEDLIAMNALYRPGPMDNIPVYIARKHGREKVAYPSPLIEEILSPTNGIMIYQEQIMQISQKMACFSKGKADELRKAMGKKKKDIISRLKDDFVAGSVNNGVEESKAAEVYDTMAKFGEYGFNRSHSAAYSVVAYQTAYLKANFPAEYMAATLTHNLNDLKKITGFIRECKRMGIAVLGPDVNESSLNFTVNQKGEIRFGLAALKNVGEKAAEEIINERASNGIFNSISDFARRINLKSVNKRCFESLAMAGAFDCMGMHRAQFFYQSQDEVSFIEKIIRYASNVQQADASSQSSLFGEMINTTIAELAVPDCQQWDSMKSLNAEFDVAGFYFSGHPLDDYLIEMMLFANTTIDEINEDLKSLQNKEIAFVGVVRDYSKRVDKNNNPFCSFKVFDTAGEMQMSLFRDDFNNFQNFVSDGARLLFMAKAQTRYNMDKVDLRIQKILPLDKMMELYGGQVKVFIDLLEVTPKLTASWSDLFKKNKGKLPLRIIVNDAEAASYVILKNPRIEINSQALANLYADPRVSRIDVYSKLSSSTKRIKG